VKIELLVDGTVKGDCSCEAEFLSFQAAVYSALSEMQEELTSQRRARAKSKMALLNETVFKTAPTDRTEEDREAE